MTHRPLKSTLRTAVLLAALAVCALQAMLADPTPPPVVETPDVPVSSAS